jgi:hypothetical protein
MVIERLKMLHMNTLATNAREAEANEKESGILVLRCPVSPRC